MKRIQKQWLASVPWQSVLSINQALCQAQKTEHKPSGTNFLTAQQVWESAMLRQMTLAEALELCKKCYNLAPFVFNNGNTFAAIAKTLIEDRLKSIAPVEAQIIRTTVAHYVAGMVGKRELVKILDHFEPVLARESEEVRKCESEKARQDSPVQNVRADASRAARASQA